MQSEKAKKSLLYIGHSYHNKTKSTLFLKDLFRTTYDVVISDFDPYNDDPETSFAHLQGREFDVLVLFQIMPDVKMLSTLIRFKHAALFPMFDGCMGLSDDVWSSFRTFNIINFSRTLHDKHVQMGLSSYYVQYFPKPVDSFEFGDSTNVFFWQRVSELNIDLVEKLLAKLPINKIHIHKALDPGQDFVEPSPKIVDKVEYSSWYESREEMQQDIESCALYIAPRPYEGIGMSFLEAMAMGRCVVAPDHPTMNEYIEHGKTGLLYDLHMVGALNVVDIQEIQKNTIEYIRTGYSQWEREKMRILDWVEAPVKKNKATARSNRYISTKSYYLFSFILLLVQKNKPNKRYYDLFGFIRILKSKRKGRKVKFYLFGIIPIWKEK